MNYRRLSNRVWEKPLQSTASVGDGDTKVYIATLPTAPSADTRYADLTLQVGKTRCTSADASSVECGRVRLWREDGYLFASRIPLPRFGSVIATIPVGNHPHGVAVDEATNRVYVANHLGNDVSVIDGDTNRVVATWRANGGNPNGIAVNSNRIFIANRNTNDVSILDSATGGLIEKRAVGQLPDGVAVTDKIWVANFGSDTVSALYSNSQARVRKDIAVSHQPSLITANPATGRVYVANHGSRSVTIIDGTTERVINTVLVEQAPYGIAYNPVTRRIYTADRDGMCISVIDEATWQTHYIKPQPRISMFVVAVNPETNHIFAVAADMRVILVYDGATEQVLTAVPIGREAEEGIAINTYTNRVYITNGADNTVTVIQNGTF